MDIARRATVACEADDLSYLRASGIHSLEQRQQGSEATNRLLSPLGVELDRARVRVKVRIADFQLKLSGALDVIAMFREGSDRFGNRGAVAGSLPDGSGGRWTTWGAAQLTKVVYISAVLGHYS